MKAVRVRVENGQITGRAPEGFPEGEVDMCLAAPDDGMGPEELERLNASLDEGWRCIEEGRLRPAADLLSARCPTDRGQSSPPGCSIGRRAHC